jgi:cobalt-zinc-cadmium efflux system outer membrane protein
MMYFLHRDNMAKHVIFFLVGIFTLTFVVPLHAQSLSDLYDHTRNQLTRIHDSSPDKMGRNVKALNDWLQGPISLQFSALPSQSAGGTDEYEVGVFLPFRPPSRREVDRQQSQLARSVSAMQEQRFSLLVSGLVRQALWKRIMAQTEYEGLLDKQAWITSLDNTMEAYLKSGEIDRATYLRWEQEKLTHSLAVKQARISLQSATRYYQQITGTESLPVQPEEYVVKNAPSLLQNHPELTLLVLSQQQLDINYDLTDQSLAPWMLGIIARQLRGPAGNDNLLGVNINIPISGSRTTSVNDQALWQDARNTLTNALAETYARLSMQLNEAVNEYEYANEAVNVLYRQMQIGEEITALYANQQQSLPKVLWLEQLIAQQDRRLEHEKMKVHLAQAASKINQIAGVTL